MAKTLWKFSRWPFQKSVAIEIDNLQCRMVSILIPCARQSHEDLDTFCRRRLRNARNICKSAGFWSEIWAKRIIKWNDHVRRGAEYKHICARLLDYNNAEWLLHQRAQFVPVDGSNHRCSVTAGRTGTRCNIGRPQPRWESSVLLARSVLNSRKTSERGNNALTIGTRIRNAFAELSTAVQQSFSSQQG